MVSFYFSLSVSFFLYLLVLITGSDMKISNLPPEPYRCDYTYSEVLDAFYKVHFTAVTWNSARAMCEAEGAALIWFNNKNEVQYLTSQFPRPYGDMFVGIHSKFSKLVFVTVKGKSIEQVYNNWAEYQPDNIANNIDCVAVSRNGTMNVMDCNLHLPFICRRELDGIQSHFNNECGIYDTGYLYQKSMHSCYKIHTEPKNWTDAFGMCTAEGAYLAVINSEQESELLVQLTGKASVYGTYWADKTLFLLGFHDMFVEGEYRTIFGETLKEAGFDSWAQGQPNNLNVQNCGALMSKGKGYLNDVWCDKPFPFICEREILTIV